VFGRLQRAHLYLEGNCDRVVRISELAELTSFSSWYFSKTFHGLYEESPQAAAARMRLEQAADLLLNSSMMIGEVAAASGFDNCCSFARAFRARFGVSASGYRAMSARPDSAKSLDLARKAVLRTGT
jgi:AraC family transcriptional regulator